MSYRELWVFIKHLPPESATQTALRDEELEGDLDDLVTATPVGEQQFGPWSHQDYLTAQLIDAVRENTYVAAISGRVDPKPDPPTPVPRPGLRRQRAVSGELAEAQILYLNKIRARG